LTNNVPSVQRKFDSWGTLKAHRYGLKSLCCGSHDTPPGVHKILPGCC